MDHYLLTLFVGFACFMGFACWTIYAVLKMAYDEDPDSLNPGKH